jgi:hypothetical protein
MAKSKKGSYVAPTSKKNVSVLTRKPGIGPKNPQNYKKGGKK